MKLIQKIFITGEITADIGLRIGGNKSSLEIGGVDINIIKSASGEPYIPGSSLKGKLRTLLGSKLHGKMQVSDDIDEIKWLFGDSGGREGGNYTRLIVRDAPINAEAFEKKFADRSKRDFEFSEVKTENRIDRSSGKAEHPRQIERVPAGTSFTLNLLLDIYEEDKNQPQQFLKMIADGFELLQLDYLGGHGSRGSGKVTITISSVTGKSISAEKGILSMDTVPGAGHFDQFMIQKTTE
jgi:CRISPR-associated protein Csm3